MRLLFKIFYSKDSFIITRFYRYITIIFFNNTNKFTNETNALADRYVMTEEEKKNAPMQAEKDETIVYSIRNSLEKTP